MQLQFDSRTAVEVGTVAAFSLSVLSLLLWRTRRTYSGFGRWVAGTCFGCVSMAGLAMRGMIPEWISVLLGNGGAFAGFVLLLEGNREFVNLPAPSRPARILASVAMLGEIYFLLSVDDISTRIVIASTCIGILTLASAATLFRGIQPNRKLGFLFAGTLFLITAVFNFGRAFETVRAGPGAAALFPAIVVSELYFGGMAIAVIGLAFGFILLTQDRMVEDLAAEDIDDDGHDAASWWSV